MASRPEQLRVNAEVTDLTKYGIRKAIHISDNFINITYHNDLW